MCERGRVPAPFAEAPVVSEAGAVGADRGSSTGATGHQGRALQCTRWLKAWRPRAPSRPSGPTTIRPTSARAQPTDPTAHAVPDRAESVRPSDPATAWPSTSARPAVRSPPPPGMRRPMPVVPVARGTRVDLVDEPSSGPGCATHRWTRCSTQRRPGGFAGAAYVAAPRRVPRRQSPRRARPAVAAVREGSPTQGHAPTTSETSKSSEPTQHHDHLRRRFLPVP